ncbi:gastrula zinc finger protein XlCGF64.1-like [Mercenaria mercenaria]|uniref:gastrula zinc finger protein XlCGF64.1-like n=1 Tax=Mercenaria mercenaria TaxID=6596 RepID=UPI00234EB0DE|nr:gastrula zinc finger protein XlCGF64.1-like [Mercenaria mercenaria]
MADAESQHRLTINALEESFHEETQTKLCADCGREFKTRSGLRKHMIRHERSHKYECAECHQKFVEKHQYESHMRKHGSDMLTCDKCHKSFTHLQSVKRYMKTCSIKEDNSGGHSSFKRDKHNCDLKLIVICITIICKSFGNIPK